MYVIRLVDGPKAGKEFRPKSPPQEFFHVVEVGVGTWSGEMVQHTYRRHEDGRYYFVRTESDEVPG